MNKTLHLTNAYHPCSGGIRTFYHALLGAAADHRRHVRLVVPSDRTRIEEVSPWARIYHLRAPASALIDHRYRLILPHRYLFGQSGPVWRILRDEQPNLIEVCDKYALVYLGGLIRRRWYVDRQRPAVAALTCERMDDNVSVFVSDNVIVRRLTRWYMRRVYMPQFDGHLAVSHYTAGELTATVRPVHVLPMGLTTLPFVTAVRSLDERLRIFGAAALDPGAVVLLYVGRLSAEKHLPLIVDTLATLAADRRWTFHLAVAGDGPLLEWLRAAASRIAPGRIHLLGHLGDRTRLASVYTNADVLVHPNPHEPFGLVPLEAMASGLPVVLPRSGGVRLCQR